MYDFGMNGLRNDHNLDLDRGWMGRRGCIPYRCECVETFYSRPWESLLLHLVLQIPSGHIDGQSCPVLSYEGAWSHKGIKLIRTVSCNMGIR